MTQATALVVLATKVDELEKTVEAHDMLLVRGEGPNQPSIPERLRKLEDVFKEVGFWVRTIALLFLGQFVVVLFTMLYGFFRILPALMALNSTQLGELAKTLLGGK